MIQEICNIGNQHHVDVFYKVAIFEATQLQEFSHLTSDATINNILTNVPDTHQVLISELLQKNIRVSNPTKISAAGKSFKTSISFLLTPQDKNLQALLDTYNNKEVVILVSKRNTNHLYGTQLQPLLFKYNEKNNNAPNTKNGYEVQLTGEGYGPAKFFENIEFNIYSRGLAFQLAQSF